MTRRGDQRLFLAGDIGGTKTNLGLFRIGKRRPVQKTIETYPSQEAPNLVSILERFLAKHPVTVAGACFGVAGPVRNGTCRITNLPWRVSEKKLKKRFGWTEVRVVNDLAATAYAVPLLTKRELFTLHPGRKVREQNIGFGKTVPMPLCLLRGDTSILLRITKPKPLFGGIFMCGWVMSVLRGYCQDPGCSSFTVG